MPPLPEPVPAPLLLILPPSLPHSALVPTLQPHITSIPSTTPVYLAVPAPFPPSPRSTSFPLASTLVASVLSTINQLTPDGQDPPDVTILLTTSQERPNFGPVVNHSKLLDMGWGKIVHAEPALSKSSDKSPPAGVAVLAGLTGKVAEKAGIENEENEVKTVAVGGTFDHLHVGHKLLLTMTAYALSPPSASDTSSSRKIIIGISGDSLLRNKAHAEYLEPWRTRVNSTLTFLAGALSPLHGLSDSPVSEDIIPVLAEDAQSMVDGKRVAVTVKGVRIECVELMEGCGPTVVDAGVEVLVVSDETRGGGEVVNREREKRGLGKLTVLGVGLVGEGGLEGKVSSTEMRRRQVEGKGKGGEGGSKI